MRCFSFIALAAVTLAACSKPAAPTNAASANALVATNAATAPPVVTPPDARLAKIFAPDVLGSNVAFLETITGPAFRTDGDDRTYKVGGCTVIVGATNGKIDNIGIDGYSPACNFPIAQYFATQPGFTLPRTPTFGDLKKGLGGVYGATCLRLCGNAADPRVTLAYSGSHADNFTDLYAAVDIGADGPALGAFTDWGNKLVARHGEPYVATGQYAAGDSAQDVAAADFAKVSPTVVRVGTNLPGAAE